MVKTSYYVGSFKKDANEGNHRGWIVGTFMEELPRKTEALEIRYWDFKVGEDTKHPTKMSGTIECTFILKGKTRAFIGSEEVILKEGDYVVIEPGTPNNLIVEILEDTIGLTIKAPSDPSAKTVLD